MANNHINHYCWKFKSCWWCNACLDDNANMIDNKYCSRKCKYEAKEKAQDE